MKLAQSLLLAFATAAASATTLAAQGDPHQGHHPQGIASSPASKAMPGKARPDMARMDTQMKAMHEMHDKMMAAKTPAEREALMAEHMKIMQDGMTMMNGMSPGGMGGTGAMKGDMKGDMAARHHTMEARMEMMQATMQMMMDRLPAAPTK